MEAEDYTATIAVTGSLTTAQYSTKRLFNITKFDTNSDLYCILAKKMTPLGLLLFVVASHIEAEGATATVAVADSFTSFRTCKLILINNFLI